MWFSDLYYVLSSTLANLGDDPNNYAGDENADEFEDYISSSDNEEEGNDLYITNYKL